jgi:hypothetical protein
MGASDTPLHGYLVAEALQSSGDAGVDESVTHADHQAAQDAWVDPGMYLYLFSGELGQAADDVCLLALVDGTSDSHLGLGNAARLPSQALELEGDGRQEM